LRANEKELTKNPKRVFFSRSNNFRWEKKNLVDTFFILGGPAARLYFVSVVGLAGYTHEHALPSHVRLLAHLMNHPAALFYIDNEATAVDRCTERERDSVWWCLSPTTR
jgi:hypothetical protein